MSVLSLIHHATPSYLPKKSCLPLSSIPSPQKNPTPSPQLEGAWIPSGVQTACPTLAVPPSKGQAGSRVCQLPLTFLTSTPAS